MSVTVDYLVVYSEEMDLMELLTEMLKNALEDVDDEPPEAEALAQHINIRYTKKREDKAKKREYCRRISGFSVEFDSAEERLGELIDNFSRSVVDYEDEGIKHLLKLHDPRLQRTLREYAKDIFEIEMKLREALSLIFANTCVKDFYNLLEDTGVRLSRTCDIDQMQKYHENQFFHLVFSQYKQINNYNPITKQEHIDFLASLRDQVELIEDLRNCVAHNRSIPEDIIANYETAKGTLLKEIDKVLNP